MKSAIVVSVEPCRSKWEDPQTLLLLSILNTPTQTVLFHTVSGISLHLILKHLPTDQTKLAQIDQII